MCVSAQTVHIYRKNAELRARDFGDAGSWSGWHKAVRWNHTAYFRAEGRWNHRVFFRYEKAEIDWLGTKPRVQRVGVCRRPNAPGNNTAVIESGYVLVRSGLHETTYSPRRCDSSVGANVVATVLATIDRQKNIPLLP